jgi:excisionase family DNA binding protein
MEQLLNIGEVEKLLNIKKSTLRAWIFGNRIPFIRVGRLIRFKPSDLEAWLNNREKGRNHGTDGNKGS